MREYALTSDLSLWLDIISKDTTKNKEISKV
jgi:hypothetical protein